MPPNEELRDVPPNEELRDVPPNEDSGTRHPTAGPQEIFWLPKYRFEKHKARSPARGLTQPRTMTHRGRIPKRSFGSEIEFVKLSQCPEFFEIQNARMNSPSHESTILPWRPIPLVIAHGVSFLLLISYIVPWSKAIWRRADEVVFFWLNSSLSGDGIWEHLWGWANTRYADIVVFFMIGLCLIYPLCSHRKEKMQSVFYTCVAMMLILLGAEEVFHYMANGMQIGGPSPTLVFSEAVRLSELLPNVPLKDASDRSFPSDHATVLLAWVGFVLINNRRRIGWLIACGSLLLIMPRLVSGAHWLSDMLVGGLVIVLPILAWTYFSPVVSRIADAMARINQPVIDVLGSLPWFRDQDFFRCASNHSIC